MSFHYGLSWNQARDLLRAGSYVRRELWTDKRLFGSSGGLVWVDATPARVVQGTPDFGREEFLALDWTDMGFDQRDCIDHPGWTHFLIDETVIVDTSPVSSRYYATSGAVGEVLPNGETTYGRRVWKNDKPWPLSMVLNCVSNSFNWRSSIVSGWQKTGVFYATVLPQETYWIEGIKGSLGAGTDQTEINITATPQLSGVRLAMLERSYPNPFSAACRVDITGTATDALLLNGQEIPLPASFPLRSAGEFSLAALVRAPATQPVARLNIEVTMSL